MEERARTAHLAAWAVRDKITFRALKTEYRLPIQAFEAFERRMKKLSLDSPDAVAAALETLQLAVRLGLPASRKAIEKRILSQGTENFDGFQRQRLEQAMQEFRRDAEDEAFFLVRAAELFEKALAREGVEEEDAENFAYLSGELYRRAGVARKGGQLAGKKRSKRPKELRPEETDTCASGALRGPFRCRSYRAVDDDLPAMRQ
ncbi:MAG: hypothetical protein U5N86_11720 [Planctomycetota bacterium]|nr:hypothetical protein [Planctomycetota bacterium]